ncbi:MAG: hypothetical protein CTY20_03745 [Hyphomicrobium sp.]|nr:MAG: hypothetical protein CTY20_03745 [Hyphomicrobium sp.]
MATNRKGSTINDIFTASMEAEAFDGVGGYDVVTYAPSRSAVRIDFTNFANNTGDALGDTYANIDSFKLTIYNDVFIGAETMDVVNGDAGNDVLEGRGGNDSLTGHSGHDTVLGGDGNDSIWGGGGNDILQGNTGNDQIWGDADSDVITGGADAGSVTATAVTERFFELPGGLRIALDTIDDYGEWVLIPKYHTVENNSAIDVLGRADGDAIFVVTNGFNDARDWNASRAGNFATINLGPNGEIPADMSVVFNGGIGNSALQFRDSEAGAPRPISPSRATETVISVTKTVVSTVVFGDSLTGGSHADTFVFNLGDGVDRINDFVKGTDKLDIAADLFDGNSANGEFAAVDHAGGALILFRDSSADGYSDNNGIFLAGLKASAIDATIFI